MRAVAPNSLACPREIDHSGLTILRIMGFSCRCKIVRQTTQSPSAWARSELWKDRGGTFPRHLVLREGPSDRGGRG